MGRDTWEKIGWKCINSTCACTCVCIYASCMCPRLCARQHYLEKPYQQSRTAPLAELKGRAFAALRALFMECSTAFEPTCCVIRPSRGAVGDDIAESKKRFRDVFWHETKFSAACIAIMFGSHIHSSLELTLFKKYSRAPWRKHENDLDCSSTF